MTLRESLGPGVHRIYEQLEALLDKPDAVLMLFDGARVVSHTTGFGVSPSQHELLGVELERTLRDVVGNPAAARLRERRNREDVQRSRNGRNVDGDDRRRAGGLLRLARKIA